MRRSEIREHIFKLLFQEDFHPQEEWEDQENAYLDDLSSIREEEREEKPGAPFLLSEEDRAYIDGKYRRIREAKEEIDAQLNAVSEGWKTGRMNAVDLAVLRQAVYEICCDPDVPVSVAINEAVELAKTFGGEASGSFVNGLLGRIARMQPQEGEKDE